MQAPTYHGIEEGASALEYAKGQSCPGREATITASALARYRSAILSTNSPCMLGYCGVVTWQLLLWNW